MYIAVVSKFLTNNFSILNTNKINILLLEQMEMLFGDLIHLSFSDFKISFDFLCLLQPGGPTTNLFLHFIFKHFFFFSIQLTDDGLKKSLDLSGLDQLEGAGSSVEVLPGLGTWGVLPQRLRCLVQLCYCC